LSGFEDECFRLHKIDPKMRMNIQVHPLAMLSKRRRQASDEMAEILVFGVVPMDEALSLMGDDPALKIGVQRKEFCQWWLSDRVMPW
jgi:hypothetical protein